MAQSAFSYIQICTRALVCKNRKIKFCARERERQKNTTQASVAQTRAKPKRARNTTPEPARDARHPTRARSTARPRSHRAIRALVAPYAPPAPANHARIANTREQRTIGCVMILCTFVAISSDVYGSLDVVRVVNIVSIACRAREPDGSSAVAVCGRDIASAW